MRDSIFVRWSAAFIFCLGCIWGCASYSPRPVEEVPFRSRAQTKTEGNVRVTAAVPSAEESRQLFGVKTYDHGVQPVWLEIENRNPEPVYFLPLSLDSNYFSPFEAAFVNHFNYETPANAQMNRVFVERSKGVFIDAGRVRSGFVFTPVDEGSKEFVVEVIGEDLQIRTFTFFIPVPGLRADHHQVDFDTFYPQQEIVDYDEKSLRRTLERLPCCTTNKDGSARGDPLNLVVIADIEELLHAFVRAGWDETEIIHAASLFKTIRSFLFGGRYRYSPFSALYLDGRPQDLSLQEARGSIHERNHLRLWLMPMRIEGKSVWAGQISRDIGVRFTTKTFVTHKIDPDVDESRDFLIQDLLYSQGLVKVAYAKGVGAASLENPRKNLTGDPYFTDGLRAVLWVSSDPYDFDEVRMVKWEIPPER